MFKCNISKVFTIGLFLLIVFSASAVLAQHGHDSKGIVKRLEGLEYKMSDQALLPDDRLAEWVLLSVKSAGK